MYASYFCPASGKISFYILITSVYKFCTCQNRCAVSRHCCKHQCRAASQLVCFNIGTVELSDTFDYGTSALNLYMLVPSAIDANAINGDCISVGKPGYGIVLIISTAFGVPLHLSLIPSLDILISAPISLSNAIPELMSEATAFFRKTLGFLG